MGLIDNIREIVNKENNDRPIVIAIEDPKAQVAKAYLEYCAKTGSRFYSHDLSSILKELD